MAPFSGRSRARLWIALLLWFPATLVPSSGLTVCLAERHVALSAATEAAEHCPCDREAPEADPRRDHGDEHSDLELPAPTEVTERGQRSKAVERVLERAPILVALAVEGVGSRAALQGSGPPRRPPRPPLATWPCCCLRTVVLRI